MSGKTGIQWTASDDGTPGYAWNPVVGCTRVSAGCDHCYAFQLHDQRHIAWKRGRWPTAPAQYHQPFSRVQLLPERLEDPLHWRKPRRVFVNSMSDLFHDAVPDEFIAQVFAVMAIASDHTFQLLTKRPARMQALMGDHTFEAMVDAQIDTLASQNRWCISEADEWPLPNVWLGVSVENQAAADARIPLLLQTPAAVRFLSCEPLLGPVDLIGDPGDGVYGPIWQKRAVQQRTDYGSGVEWDVELTSGIDWCIIGGESGKHARVMNPAWSGSLVDQCREAGVAVFMKQMGTVWAKTNKASDSHGGNPLEWPEEHRVREFPQTARAEVVAR